MDSSDCFGQRQSDGSRKGSFRLWLGHKPLEVRGHISPSLHRPAIGMVLWAHLLGVQEALWLKRGGQRQPPFPKPHSGVLGPDPFASSRSE